MSPLRKKRRPPLQQAFRTAGDSLTLLPRLAIQLPARALGLAAAVPRRRVGAPPGSLPEIPEDERTPVRVRAYRYDADAIEEHTDLTIAEAEALREAPGITWVDVVGVRDPEGIGAIGAAFGLHPLVQEDIINTHQRPKLESYPAMGESDEQLFIVAKMLHTDQSDGSVSVEQVGFLLGQGYLLSFQEVEGDVFGPVRERLRLGAGRIRRLGADYLAYALLDVIVDHYFSVIEGLGEQIELLEEDILAAPRQEHQGRLRALRRTALFLRRSIWPLREVLGTLAREESPLIDERTRIYLRDAHDHAVQVVDLIESFRDVLASLSDLYLSSLSHRMNEVMKVLTVVGTIFIPLSFFAGIYGMNFEYMPELGFRYGYFVWLATAAFLLVGSLAYFRRKGWI